MGKAHNKKLSVVQQQQSDGSAASTTTFLFRRCWLTLFTPKCAVVLLIGVVLFFLPFSLSSLFVIGTLGLMLKTPSSLLVVLMHVTNNKGSTKDPPVTLEASVVSDIGTLQSQRLKQIARIITRSPPAENLGLNHTVFGKVKEISLSSFSKAFTSCTTTNSFPMSSSISGAYPTNGTSIFSILST